MIIGLNGKIGSGKDTVASIILLTIAGVPAEDIAYQLSLTKLRNPKALSPGTNWEVKRYADKLKQFCAQLIGCRVEDFEDQEFKKKQLGLEWNRWVVYHCDETYYFEDEEEANTYIRLLEMGNFVKTYRAITVRELLQLVGTNALRKVVNQNVWVNALFSDYQLKTQVTLIGKKVPGGLYEYNYEGKPVFAPTATAVYNTDPYFPSWIISDIRFPNELRPIEDRGGQIWRINRKRYFAYVDGQYVSAHTKPPLAINDESTDRYITDSEEIRRHFPEHISETALDDHPFSIVIDNNDGLATLIATVQNLLKATV